MKRYGRSCHSCGPRPTHGMTHHAPNRPTYAAQPPQMVAGAMHPARTAPSRVAPVQQVMHPTRYQEQRRVTRYPIEHIYPVHTNHIHDHVCEHRCRNVYSESHQDCYHNVNVNCCPDPTAPRRRPYR